MGAIYIAHGNYLSLTVESLERIPAEEVCWASNDTCSLGLLRVRCMDEDTALNLKISHTFAHERFRIPGMYLSKWIYA